MAKSPPETPGNDTTETIDLGALPGYVGYQVRQAQIAVFKDIAKRLESLTLTPGEFSLLSLIETNPGISQTALVQIYDLDKSTLSHAINGLNERKLIERHRAASDRRRHELVLSLHGQQMVNDARVQIETQEDIMAAALKGDERKQLLDMLKRIAKQLNEPGNL